MTDLLLFITALGLGYLIRKNSEVKIIIKVDAKQAIKDLGEAEYAIKKLKKEMNI